MRHDLQERSRLFILRSDIVCLLQEFVFLREIDAVEWAPFSKETYEVDKTWEVIGRALVLVRHGSQCCYASRHVDCRNTNHVDMSFTLQWRREWPKSERKIILSNLILCINGSTAIAGDGGHSCVFVELF